MAEGKSLYELLRNRYPVEECILMEEVSNAPGFSRSRSLDYMVMNLWQSRGIYLTGIEKKISRSDWLRELKNPLKQEDHFKYCDYFYLLTGDDGVAKIEEIPDRWGWMAVVKGKLITLKDAPKLSPEAVTKGFLSCLLRRASNKEGWVRRDSIQSEIDTAVSSKTSRLEQNILNVQEDRNDLSKKIREFERASGLNLPYRTNEKETVKLGEAVRVILKGDFSERIKELKRCQEIADRVKSALDRDLEILNSVLLQQETYS